ncbi:MAG TPA: HD domain-containing protein [Tepidisphaeraceae bacterium]|nr:HD domain-containing protein [Tepidisphaeraceae bacterium]
MPASEKIIRDPVHDVIAFRPDRPLDALLFRLLNAAEFQRLRRIRQLGMASLAYPGADHSRYSHSLGVMETARRMLDQLRRVGFAVDDEGEAVCVAAALLHDLGHGPFSHVFERVSGIRHERLTQRVIRDPDSEVHRILFQHDRLMPEKVVEFLNCRPRRTFHCDIISSQLDADRFDYLLRDNLHTGSRYGRYDLQWLLHALTIDQAGDRLAITWKGVSAVEAYLQARFLMYRNVYFHKVVRAAEGMVKLALQRAKRLLVQGRLRWPTPESGVGRAMLGQRMTMDEFRDLDDVSVTHCLKLWADEDDAVLAALCRGLLFRRVFKTIDLSRTDPEQAAAQVTDAEAAVRAAGGDPAYELFYDQAESTPYETFSPRDDAAAGTEILVSDAAGTLTPLASVSPFVQSLSRQLMFRRLHVAPQWRDVVAKAVGPVLSSGTTGED